MGEICEVMMRRGARGCAAGADLALTLSERKGSFGEIRVGDSVSLSRTLTKRYRAMMAGDGPRLAPPQNLAPGTLVLLTQLASQVHTLRVSEVS